ncbi:uncharacterized protein K460DRAFT_356714 [Cucurbitaria berberidis CBS 394.84]|uniref:Uncharacterized protein n=1 Tax=Cucurbitaria berberidis CBS 394.84 TaxID=1168544 RepID=A0A9P4GCW0_9PLEO|nr:uncharacterized protein K460DRAFT_356714 [Cucurbitaria berberidis CBS 394.84]KAF1842919.1 hypothetical protein K460DRAFT_356714 [Cucurbitaria berberidis CBS 394.84]
MSGNSTNCLTRTTIKPNSTTLAGIAACQAAANTAFCYPPNGTRICVPEVEIPFYWPASYYPPGSGLAVSFDNFSTFYGNTGNRTENFMLYVYNFIATNISGVQNEKTIQMSIRERHFDNKKDPFNLKKHDGPTLILVKTAETLASRTSTSDISWATATRRPRYKTSNEPTLSPGGIVGILIGVVFGIVALIWCFRSFCCAARERASIDRKEQARIVGQGSELMFQGGVAARRGIGQCQVVSPRNGLLDSRSGPEDFPRVEEARIWQRRGDIERTCEEDPPPKYTP